MFSSCNKTCEITRSAGNLTFIGTGSVQSDQPWIVVPTHKYFETGEWFDFNFRYAHMVGQLFRNDFHEQMYRQRS